MIYGNHNKKKGDIVQIARWEDETLRRASLVYDTRIWTIDDVRFIVLDIEYNWRKIRLIPRNPKVGTEVFYVDLDATSLIRVGRLSDAQ